MPEGRIAHRVEWAETDAAGVVYFANFFRYFDRGTHTLLDRIGVPLTTLLAHGQAVPLIEAHARYLAPLKYADRIEIVSRIEEVRTRAFRVAHTVWSGDRVTCEGYEVRILGAVGGGRLEPRAIPPEMRAVLTAG